MSDETKLVKFTRNVDPSEGTGAITFRDDRPDLEIGGVGEVTEEEFNNLSGRVALEELEESDPEAKAYREAQKQADENTPVNISEADGPTLRQVAEDEGVDIKGLRTNDDIQEAISEHRAEREEGQESLPATATLGPLAPAPGGGEGQTG